MKVGIVGGGLMGLWLAQQLNAIGHEATIFERDEQLGGLATHHDFGPFTWDRFYHVILPTDTHLVRMIREIGLEQDLRWRRTLTGFYVDDQLYSLSSNLEFLKFPKLGIVSKMRLAYTILYCSRINDWRPLEKIPVDEWLIRHSGRKTYEKFWKPLLLAKLGENYRRVSAVFIWSYIKRLYSARDTAASREQLGHVRGGYKTIFDRLAALVESGGGEIRRKVTVERIAPAEEGGIDIESAGQCETFDKVICTSPVNALRAMAADGLVDVSASPRDVEYLGVVCLVLVTRRPLVPYYVVNIADASIPFTGVIGMSGVVSTDETAGLYLTYLPKYVHSDDAYLRKPDDDVRAEFLDGLSRMLPDFRRTDIVSATVNRAVKVQPIQVMDYSSIVPTVRTRHPDFYVLNTAQFVNGTLNNNSVVKAVDAFLSEFGSAFGRNEPRQSENVRKVA